VFSHGFLIFLSVSCLFSVKTVTLFDTITGKCSGVLEFYVKVLDISLQDIFVPKMGS